MPVLKCLKPFPYGEARNRVKLKPGDIFKCKEKHVPLLVHAGLATKPDVVISEPVPVYQTRHMEAAKPKTVAELRAEAEARGVHLPRGYITKAQLMDILDKAAN